MDTTPEYILKCERSKETQALSPLSETNYVALGTGLVHGDVLNGNVHNTTFGDFVYYRIRPGWNLEFDEVWLPRQDELQKMIDWNPWQLAARFAEFAHLQAGDKNTPFTSMEQLWLAAIMDWNLGKVWDSEKEEWVTKA